LELEQQFEAHVTTVKLQIQNATRNLVVQNARTKESLKLDEMNSTTKSAKMTTHKTSSCE